MRAKLFLTTIILLLVVITKAQTQTSVYNEKLANELGADKYGMKKIHVCNPENRKNKHHR